MFLYNSSVYLSLLWVTTANSFHIPRHKWKYTYPRGRL